MNCLLCETLCVIPDGSILYSSTTNIAVIKEDGIIMCIACSEVSDWANSSTFIKKDPSDKKEKPSDKKEDVNQTVQTASSTSVYCAKCKDRFTTRLCKCGFKNPLFRK